MEGQTITFRKSFIFLICQREFADELTGLAMSPNLEQSPDIKTKVLSLIQSWALAFSSDRDLSEIAEVYMDLKNKGVDFPLPSDEDLKETDSEVGNGREYSTDCGWPRRP